MKSKIQKWGNSLAVRIPKNIADSLCVGEGSAVEIEAKDGQMVVRPKSRKERLKELLDQIDPKDEREIYDWGKPRGREVW